MALIPLALLLALSAGVAQGQDSETKPAPAPSAQALERVAALDREVEALQAELQAEHARARAEHAAEVEQAAKEGREAPARPMLPLRPDFSKLLERLFAWADEDGGEDAALYLTRAVRLDGLGKESRGRLAFERLLAQHPGSPSWARLGSLLPQLGRAFDTEECRRVLEVLGKSPDADVRGWVALARHGEEVAKAPLDSETYTAAKAALEAALAAATDPQLKGELRAPIDLRERLSTGVQAPDIEGVDLDGVAFKLSDYRGKIILLSFWGDW